MSHKKISWWQTIYFTNSHIQTDSQETKKITFFAQSYASNIVTATRDTHCEANVAWLSD